MPHRRLEDEGCAALLGCSIGLYVWFQSGAWLQRIAFPYASGLCGVMLTLAGPCVLAFAALLIWSIMKDSLQSFRRPAAVSLLVAVVIYGGGVALDVWEAEKARKPKMWDVWGSPNGLMLTLETSWEVGQLTYRLTCPGSYCPAHGTNVLIDLMEGRQHVREHFGRPRRTSRYSIPQPHHAVPVPQCGLVAAATLSLGSPRKMCRWIVLTECRPWHVLLAWGCETVVALTGCSCTYPP
jgi:hypothetical protein